MSRDAFWFFFVIFAYFLVFLILANLKPETLPIFDYSPVSVIDNAQ